MKDAAVLDCRGMPLSPCTADRARDLLRAGKAELLSEEPLVIRLTYAVDRPSQRDAAPRQRLQGQRVLLHVCCGPCATYTVQRLREEGAELVGYWFNPNIHPYAEHERRREALAQFGRASSLPIIWEPGYAMPLFFQAIAGRERFRERCLVCYRLRLERAAQVAVQEGLKLFTTTLLISPYQDQEALRRIGESVAQAHGVEFYFENLRRGFGEHYRLARECGLYMQRYCGCLYSEWEAQDRRATTLART